MAKGRRVRSQRVLLRANKIVRKDGYIEYINGARCGMRPGYYAEIHAEGHPASIAISGQRAFYDHGDVSRDDGPALFWPDGEMWWSPPYFSGTISGGMNLEWKKVEA